MDELTWTGWLDVALSVPPWRWVCRLPAPPSTTRWKLSARRCHSDPVSSSPDRRRQEHCGSLPGGDGMVVIRTCLAACIILLQQEYVRRRCCSVTEYTYVLCGFKVDCELAVIVVCGTAVEQYLMLLQNRWPPNQFSHRSIIFRILLHCLLFSVKQPMSACCFITVLTQTQSCFTLCKQSISIL